MKKIILSLAAAAIVLPISAFAVQGNGYEYITSPDRIPLYKQIRKEGMKLYGVLKEDKELPRGQKDNPAKKLGLDAEKKTEQMKEKNKNWEKIPHPAMIKNYEGVRPVGNALWGYRKKRDSLGFKDINAENAPCISTAIVTRDGLLANAATARSAADIAALNDRTSCMTAALSALGENLSEELAACNDAYESSVKDSKKAYADAHDEAWSGYRNSLKTCAEISNPDDEEADDDTADEVEELDDDSTEDDSDEDDPNNEADNS